jgi:hypothetical protein
MANQVASCSSSLSSFSSSESSSGEIDATAAPAPTAPAAPAAPAPMGVRAPTREAPPAAVPFATGGDDEDVLATLVPLGGGHATAGTRAADNRRVPPADDKAAPAAECSPSCELIAWRENEGGKDNAIQPASSISAEHRSVWQFLAFVPAPRQSMAFVPSLVGGIKPLGVSWRKILIVLNERSP